MSELLAGLDAFLQEHRRCGERDGGVDGDRVWMACGCGAKLSSITPTFPTDTPDVIRG